MPRHPHTSSHANTLRDDVFSQLVAIARQQTGKIHPLHVGDTYREPLVQARAEAQLTSEHPRLHNYAPVQGEPVLLDAIERRLRKRVGRQVPRDDIQVTSGATSGLSVIASVLFEPGDEVILPSPYWPLIRGIIAGRGAVPVEVPFFDRLSDPTFDPEKAIEQAITDRTVALYINTPNNPSGAILPDDVVAACARVAKKHDLWVLCDEAYEELWFTEERPDPLWDRADLGDRAIAAHTLSKSYGLAGARIGFVHGPSEVMGRIRGAQTFSTYCASRPMQFGAARALDEGDGWLDEARAEYHAAARATAEALGIPAPDGGTFLFFDAAPLLGDAPLLSLLTRCLEAGVLLTPGSASGRDYASWIRLCFTSVPPAELADALETLRPILRRP